MTDKFKRTIGIVLIIFSYTLTLIVSLCFIPVDLMNKLGLLLIPAPIFILFGCALLLFEKQLIAFGIKYQSRLYYKNAENLRPTRFLHVEYMLSAVLLLLCGIIFNFLPLFVLL